MYIERCTACTNHSALGFLLGIADVLVAVPLRFVVDSVADFCNPNKSK